MCGNSWGNWRWLVLSLLAWSFFFSPYSVFALTAEEKAKVERLADLLKKAEDDKKSLSEIISKLEDESTKRQAELDALKIQSEESSKKSLTEIEGLKKDLVESKKATDEAKASSEKERQNSERLKALLGKQEALSMTYLERAERAERNNLLFAGGGAAAGGFAGGFFGWFLRGFFGR